MREVKSYSLMANVDDGDLLDGSYPGRSLARIPYRIELHSLFVRQGILDSLHRPAGSHLRLNANT